MFQTSSSAIVSVTLKCFQDNSYIYILYITINTMILCRLNVRYKEVKFKRTNNITVLEITVRPISHYDRTRWPNISPAHLEFSSSRCCQSINYVRSVLSNVRPKGRFERTYVPWIKKNYFQHWYYREHNWHNSKSLKV